MKAFFRKLLFPIAVFAAAFCLFACAEEAPPDGKAAYSVSLSGASQDAALLVYGADGALVGEYAQADGKFSFRAAEGNYYAVVKGLKETEDCPVAILSPDKRTASLNVTAAAYDDEFEAYRFTVTALCFGEGGAPLTGGTVTFCVEDGFCFSPTTTDGAGICSIKLFPCDFHVSAMDMETFTDIFDTHITVGTDARFFVLGQRR